MSTGCAVDAGALRRLVDGRRARRVEQAGGALDGDRLLRLEHAQRQPDVLERGVLRTAARSSDAVAACARRRSRHEQRVDAAGMLEVLLQPRERHEHGADVALLRPQRELAELGRAEDRRATVEPQRAPGSSFRPCSDSIGIADGRSIRTSTVLSAAAPISAASAGLRSASRPAGRCTPATPWKRQKRSSTP